MLDLLQNYSLEQIMIFIVMLAFAIKGVIDFYDWAKARVHKVNQKENEKAMVKEDIQKLFDIQVSQNEAIDKLTKSVDLLIRSDKDQIKAWITEKHHYFCYEVKHIDDYSLDSIERRYAHYTEEGGNSFVADLMADLRSLRKVSSTLSIQDNEINKKD